MCRLPTWWTPICTLTTFRVAARLPQEWAPRTACTRPRTYRSTSSFWFVVTGDTLFVGTVGRPDLAGREAKMAGMLYDSLHSKLLALPDSLEVFPGHQAGSACGAGLSGKPSSTIGFEKRWNPALSMDRAAFIASVTRNIPPRPARMDEIVAANTAA